MREFGDLGGIVVNTGTGSVVGGHQRLRQLDPAWRIEKKAVHDKTGTVAEGWIQTPWGRIAYREVAWPLTKEKAANLAANKHGGDFDMEGVQGILADLEAAKYDLDLTGFLPDERLDLLPPKEEHKDPDGAPTQAPRRTRRGEVWTLGRHRIAVDDAADLKTWSKLFRHANAFGEPPKAAVVFTDPPYGVDYTGHDKIWERIANDKKSRDDLFRLLCNVFIQSKKWTAPTAAYYVWHASATREDFAHALKAAGLMERQYIIWAKPGILLGHADYNWAHEPCFYAHKAGESPKFYGDRTQSTMWRVGYSEAKNLATVIGPGVAILDGKGGVLYIQAKTPKGRKLRQFRLEEGKTAILSGFDEAKGNLWEVGKDHGYQHPTQKPVELARRAIENSSRTSEIVADPFLGSGTTLIAAEITGRACYGMEIDPKYADVILARWERFTDKKATKEK